MIQNWSWQLLRAQHTIQSLELINIFHKKVHDFWSDFKVILYCLGRYSNIKHHTVSLLSKYSSIINNWWHRHTFMVVLSCLVIIHIKSILSQLPEWLSASLHWYWSHSWTAVWFLRVIIELEWWFTWSEKVCCPVNMKAKPTFFILMVFSIARSLSMHRIRLRNLPWGSISEKHIKADLSNGKAAVQSLRGRLHVGKTLNMIPQRVQLSTILLSYGGIQELKSIWNFHG